MVVAVVVVALTLVWTFFAVLYANSSEKAPCVGDLGLGVQLALALLATAAAVGSLSSALDANHAQPGAIRRFAIRLAVAGAAFTVWAFVYALACG